jgi:mono/diheme cytochrome c family protein
MTKHLVFIILIALSFVFMVLGCTLTGNSTSSVGNESSSIESQLASGAAIYKQTCATSTCHGTNGEGIRSATGFKAWPLVGDEFQSRHPNAQVVFDVIRSGGERNLLALTDQQIYDAIAYQLSQNQITLDSPLTSDNALATYGGAMSGEAKGGLFPPSDDATLIRMPRVRDLPIATQNEKLRLQLDQIAQASAIGNANGTFLTLVIVFNDLDAQPITISPDHLGLFTPRGELLKPQSTNIHSAIEKFHEQTIKPQHGTVGLVVFTLTAPDQFDRLIYDDGAGNQLTLALKP